MSMKTLRTYWCIGFLLPMLSIMAQVWEPVSGKEEIRFSIRNFGLLVHGSFSGLQASLDFNPKHPEKGRIWGEVPVNSIETGIKKRDEHLKSPDYFDSEKYPVIRLNSLKITGGSGEYVFEGELSLHGITRPQQFTFFIAENEGQMVVSAHFSLNRQDFALGPESGPMGNEVEVQIRAVFKMRAPPE